jgi:pimeloyl-ACP methyl ester carboxylesterase
MNLPTAPSFSPSFSAAFCHGPHGQIAFDHQTGARPGVVFLHGFNSDMQGGKATALAEFCTDRGQAYLRFDCRAHGQSAGDFADFTIGGALDDALWMFDNYTDGPQVLVGSSMGGWLAMLLALARPQRVAAVIGLAPAPDFTDQILHDDLNDDQRAELARAGRVFLPSQYGGEYLITQRLIDDGRAHFVMDKLGAIGCPLHILHGQEDTDVAWQQSLDIAACWGSADVAVTLIKDGDHRLSREGDLALLTATLAGILA